MVNKGYYWQHHQYDPSYSYLFNGLGIIGGHSPHHTNHPGTPLQSLIALILSLEYHWAALTQTELLPLNERVVLNPEYFLHLANTVLVILFLGMMLVVGRLGQKYLSSPIQWLTLQAPLLLCYTPIVQLYLVKPEVVILILGQCLVAMLLIYVFRPGVERNLSFAIALGALLGISLATKLTTIPWLLVLLLIPTWKCRGILLVSTVTAFIAGTLPIASRYIQIRNFLIMIISHPGNYEAGHWGNTSLLQLIKKQAAFFMQDPTFFIITGFVLLMLVFTWVKGRKTIETDHILKRSCLVTGLFFLMLVIQMGLTVIELPKAHYLLPTMSLAGLALSLAFYQLSSNRPAWLNKKPLLPVILSLFLGGILLTNGIKTADYLSWIKKDSQIWAKANHIFKHRYSHCGRIYPYRGESPEVAMLFAYNSSHAFIRPLITEYYPNTLFLLHTKFKGKKRYHLFSFKKKIFDKVEQEHLFNYYPCLMMAGIRRPVNFSNTSPVRITWHFSHEHVRFFEVTPR